jgi:hypothetical protein
MPETLILEQIGLRKNAFDAYSEPFSGTPSSKMEILSRNQ